MGTEDEKREEANQIPVPESDREPAGQSQSETDHTGDGPGSMRVAVIAGFLITFGGFLLWVSWIAWQEATVVGPPGMIGLAMTGIAMAAGIGSLVTGVGALYGSVRSTYAGVVGGILYGLLGIYTLGAIPDIRFAGVNIGIGAVIAGLSLIVWQDLRSDAAEDHPT